VIAETPVRVDREGPVAVVTLSRPGKSNAMDGEITEALLAALGSLSARGDVGAMVLTGQGAAFSAGGDVETIKEMGQDRMFRDAILGAHLRLFHTMTRLPFASVAAVNGAAVGAGVTVALLCDLVVMADTAFLSDPRVSLGLLDGAGGIVLWPLLTSLSAAKEYLLLGERLGGDEAHRLGLVNRVVPQDDVHVEALRLAHRLAALPRQAATQMRRLLNNHMDQLEGLLEESTRAEYACFDTDEHSLLLEQLSERLATKPAREAGKR
jgi:enoyl-CoA hydratase